MGMISTLRPKARAVFAVIGPMHATRVFLRRPGTVPGLNMETKFETVEDEVKVTTSMEP